MSKLLYCAIVLLFMQSCWVDKIADNNREQRQQIIKAIDPYVDYSVSADGKRATIVKWGDDTIAATRTSMTVKAPKSAVVASELQTTYSDDKIFESFGYSKYWQYVGFEDTRFGDYDYNDIVLHARVVFTKSYDNTSAKSTISVQPVALGSRLDISVGILYKDSPTGLLKEMILIENARKELFDGLKTFPINTDPNADIVPISKKLRTLATINLDPTMNAFDVVWFIEAGGNRFYAATTNFSDVDLNILNNEAMPYGLSFTQTWDYPAENTNIRECYPNFDQWLKSGDEKALLTNRQSSKCYPAGLRKLWDYEK